MSGKAAGAMTGYMQDKCREGDVNMSLSKKDKSTPYTRTHTHAHARARAHTHTHTHTHTPDRPHELTHLLSEGTESDEGSGINREAEASEALV